MMTQIEQMFPEITSWRLDTPEWNRRTNQFYKKLGYQDRYHQDGFVFFEKKRV